ncbi:NERD domain-containing protein [Candidatus Saccharibacteria bacterium]|nr:NERD domain-containing protein [Candidatus Saccharibacteria bacterium]
MYNPFRQNYKHIRALESLLGLNLKAPIHSYIVFPNARDIKIDGTSRAASIQDVVNNISRHKTQIYNLQECERILRSLAYASSKKEELVGLHADEVRAYVASI